MPRLTRSKPKPAGPPLGAVVRCEKGDSALDPALLPVPGIVGQVRRRVALVLFPEAARSVWVPKALLRPAERADVAAYPLTGRIAVAVKRWGERGFEIEGGEDGTLLLQLENEGMDIDALVELRDYFRADGAEALVLPAGMHRLRIEVRYPASGGAGAGGA